MAVTGLKGPGRGVNSCGYERDPLFILAQASRSQRMQNKTIVVDLEDYMITYIVVVRANRSLFMRQVVDKYQNQPCKSFVGSHKNVTTREVKDGSQDSTLGPIDVAHAPFQESSVESSSAVAPRKKSFHTSPWKAPATPAAATPGLVASEMERTVPRAARMIPFHESIDL